MVMPGTTRNPHFREMRQVSPGVTIPFDMEIKVNYRETAMGQRGMAPPGWHSVVFLVRIVFAVVVVGVPVAGAQVAVKLLRNAFSLGGSVPAIYYVSYLIVSVLVT
jgi:hypothetical protein